MVEFLPFKEKVLVQVQVFSVVEVLTSSSREVREPTAVGGYHQWGPLHPSPWCCTVLFFGSFLWLSGASSVLTGLHWC